MNKYAKPKYLARNGAIWDQKWIIVKLSPANLAMGVSYEKIGDVMGTKNEVLYWDTVTNTWDKKKSKALAKYSKEQCWKNFGTYTERT